jgi:hypothetical protein
MKLTQSIEGGHRYYSGAKRKPLPWSAAGRRSEHMVKRKSKTSRALRSSGVPGAHLGTGLSESNRTLKD